MEKIILLLNICLPNDGMTECIFFSEKEFHNQQMCEQRMELLHDEFSDVAETLNIKCERVEA